jgi:hypothetical protein
MINLIQKANKCSKEKCSNELNKVVNDKKLKLQKEKLFKTNDIDAKEKLITNIYSNKNQIDLDLCNYKKCKKINKTLQNNKLKLMNDKIKLYNIILPKKYQIKYDELIKLTSKSSITDEEYLKIIILFQILNRFISSKYMENVKPFFDAHANYYNCGREKCKTLFNNVSQDKDFFKKKISIFSIKDDKKRNKVIEEVYSNEKQVKLDKCVANKCNNISLKLIQEILKLYEKKIKYFKIKIPEDLKFHDIKKITNDDIPELIIKINKLSRYIDKNEYIANI